MIDFEDVAQDDVFKILVATDIHLGYGEKDPVRDQDTFDTFEEILQIAEAEDVDFILLGGDLFHHSKPSPYCIYKCTELLKRYCLGDRAVEVEFLSNPNITFSTSMVNYEDPNLNISMPVFSIHGNHDDPIGQKQISAMDLLATSGLINYFGKCKSYDEINVDPLCFKKGETKLALFGLSHVKDERLGRLFLDKKVSFKFQSREHNYFNLLVWHQNRAVRGTKNYIPDDCLPEQLDLVIWGHEHDCRIKPEEKNKVYISQPGSSVATSLTEGESITKKVGILKIYKNNFTMTAIELKSVRPFIYKELVLQTFEEMINMNDECLTITDFTIQIVTNKVNEMIADAKRLDRNRRVSEKPLIRLNVRCRDERQVFNTIRFGQNYMGEVANPEDMVKCTMIKERTKGAGKNNDEEIDTEEIISANRVEDIVASFFQEKDTLKLLPVSAINEAVKKFIDANDTDAVSDVAEHYKKETLKKMEKDMPEIEDVDDWIKMLKTQQEEETSQHITNLLNNPKRQQNQSTQGPIQDFTLPKDPKVQQKRSTLGSNQQVRSVKPAVSKKTKTRDDDEAYIIDDDDDDEIQQISSIRPASSRQCSIRNDDDDDDNSENFSDLDSDFSERSLHGVPRRYLPTANDLQQTQKNQPSSRRGRGSRGGRGSRSRGRSK